MCFLRGQTSEKICQYKKSQSRCLFHTTKNEKRLILKTIMANYGWKGSFFFLNAVATLDVVRASEKRHKTSQNPNCKFCVSNIVVSFWENKQTRTWLLVFISFITCLAPELQRDIPFIPFILKRVLRWKRSIWNLSTYIPISSEFVKQVIDDVGREDFHTQTVGHLLRFSLYPHIKGQNNGISRMKHKYR